MTVNDGREKILEASKAYFYTNGYNNTGIADILKQARLTKPSLYHHFGSKQGLGMAYLQQQELEIFSIFERWAAEKATLRDYLHTWSKIVKRNAAAHKFHGCPFANFAQQMNSDDFSFFGSALNGIEDRWKNLLMNFFERLKKENKLKAEVDNYGLGLEVLTIFQGSNTLWRMTANLKYLDDMNTLYHSLCDRVEA